MNVSMVGTGYIGLVSGTCFAEIGHTVTCIDVDKEKIRILKEGGCPIYEPGLIDLLERNVQNGRLSFATDFLSVKNARVIFLGVGTPSLDNGEANLQYLTDAAISVAKNISDDAIIVIKSTVPVGTHKMIKELVAANTTKKFHIVNNPEFLKEGAAIDDFMKPDRVVIGHSDEEAAAVLEELYEPLVRQGHPIYKMSNLSAEMTKYAANAFLATKISFINEIARFCDACGADIEEVRKGITSDRRIGTYFLYPGPGYGGSCFPKDVKAIIKTALKYGVELQIAKATEEVNAEQKLYMFHKIKARFDGKLKGKIFAFWGVAFKANTDDVRDTPAFEIASALVKEGAQVQFFDPEASENFMKMMDEHKGSLKVFKNKYDCLNGANALVLLTEWPEFRAPDFIEIKSRLKEGNVFDARNLYAKSKVEKEGLFYTAIGKAR